MCAALIRGLCALLVVGAGSAGARAQEAGGPLAQRWCGDSGSARFKAGRLVVEEAGEESTFRDVRFDGCNGAVCTYVAGRGGFRWTATRAGSGLVVRGPVYLSGSGRPRILTLTFSGPC